MRNPKYSTSHTVRSIFKIQLTLYAALLIEVSYVITLNRWVNLHNGTESNQGGKACNLIFIVVPCCCCMLFQSVLYCSNSCTSLHFKILKSHTKTLKNRPYMFRSPLKPSSGGPWPYFVRLLNWNVDLHLL
jgi:hypothetical protein